VPLVVVPVVTPVVVPVVTPVVVPPVVVPVVTPEASGPPTAVEPLEQAMSPARAETPIVDCATLAEYLMRRLISYALTLRR
jgi:hypothetical protein